MSARILSFTPRPKNAATRDAAGEALAAIIIFPGVRYERLDDEESCVAAFAEVPAQPAFMPHH